MRKILLSLLAILFIGSIGLLINKYQLQDSNKDIVDLREQHEAFLKNSPFKESLKLSKKERKAQGLPPNKYSERMWELTMNPQKGYPEPGKLFKLQDELTERAKFAKVPGEDTNSWVERGPDNVGGRTRAIMYDPNDATNKRVFAGGVSGGLWVNNDITDANSAWAEVGIPDNLAISCITYDPNNTNTFYVGTGESYVAGDVNGNGVWKSTDGGSNWARVFGGVTGETDVITGTSVPGNARIIVNTPASIAGEYFGQQAGYGPALEDLTGDLVLADDGTAAPNEACNALTNGAAMAGNIAILYRGSCGFSLKVLNAQNAGAVAVIVVNNVADTALVTMAGGDDGDSVTIPSIFVTQADGQTLINALASGVNVSIGTLPPSYAGYNNTPGVQHINDIVVRDIGSGNSEVFVAAGSSLFRTFPGGSAFSTFGLEDYGLYKSSNGGSSWSEIDMVAPAEYKYNPNDLEIGSDNTIWLSTTSTPIFSDGGGEILSSTDGINFNLQYTVPNGSRTQIAVSNSDASTLYVLAATGSTLALLKTTDAFATTPAVLNQPDDADTGIPADDFTRGQASYDLTLEVDPANDNIIYVGGIDLFRSADSGTNWDQISKWSNNNNLAALNVSLVHADQHAMTFDPSDSNKALFGHDGGVSYATSLTEAAATGTSGIEPRVNNYNTLQFYNGAIGQEVANEKLLAGSQDNGSQLINNASAGINSSTEITGGDGAYVFIDKNSQYMISSIYYNRYFYKDYTTGGGGYTIDSDEGSGDFINSAALDSDINYLYTNGTSDADYKVNVYALEASSATKTTITAATLDGTPTAFKPLASGFFLKYLLVGTENGKLFKVSLGSSGSTWVEITGAGFAGSISCIETGATEDDIYVTFYNYGVSNVFYSSNGGSTWQNKEGDLPDLPVRAILSNPLNRNEVILATDLGVWGTADFSATAPDWARAQNGMKDVKVTSFDLRIVDNTVLASTYGRGMFTGQFTADASTLSLDNVDFNDAIKVYPTISDGNFKIAASNEVSNGILNIYDLNGREVYTSKIDFNSNRIQNISLNQSSGMYIVKFKSDTRESSYKIVIK